MNRPKGALRAVLFDLDGVLADTFDAWSEVLEDCRRRRRLPPLGRRRILEAWGQGIAADCETFFPGATPARLAEEYREGFFRHLALVRPVDGAPEAVADVRARGLAAAVVTNSPRGMARGVLAALGFDGAFDALCCGDEVLRGKPAPGLVQMALARVGANAGEAALVGDTPLDIEAARRAGVLAIGYRTDGDRRIDDLRSLPALLGSV